MDNAIATAIAAHAAAILELAQAIREHTQAQFITVDEDEDEPATCYMDGTPIQ